MDFFEVLTHLLALALGGAAGSFLTLKVVKKSIQQNNNTVNSTGSVKFTGGDDNSSNI